MRWVSAAILLGVALAPQAARADCQADIDALAKRIAQVKPAETRVKLEGMLERARRELLEGEETDCHYATQQVVDAMPKKP